MNTFNQLRSFFDAIKTLTFWQRVFSWSSVRKLSYAALEEFVQLTEALRQLTEEKNNLSTQHQLLSQEKISLEQQAEGLRFQLHTLKTEKDNDIRNLKEQLGNQSKDLHQKDMTIRGFEQDQQAKNVDHQKMIDKAIAIQQLFENEKQRLSDERVKEQKDRQEKLRKTWSEHEKAVEQDVRRICESQGIEYVTDFPFRGKPDNAIRIAGDMIVFDAKSPQGDDLGNFKTYIRQQAEAAKKYTGNDGVRKDVYLVVPANAVEVLDVTAFNMGNYMVYVITRDALEPVILSLRQIEVYEFVDQLSPEERQSICRIIGSLIYASKRRIQVDQYFNGHLLELIARVQREIPESMQEMIAESERAMKLNPSNDRRTKEINTASLDKAHHQLGAQAAALEAPTPQLVEIKYPESETKSTQNNNP